MKKIGLIAGGLFLVLILSGCGKNEKSNPSNGEQNNQEVNEISADNNQESPAGQVAENENSAEGGVMKKLKNALSSGKKMKCTYSMGDEKEKTEIITYVQGDKYKTEVNVGQIKTISIFDGDAMYSWSEGQKTGTKMAMSCLNSLDTRSEAESNPVSEESSVADEEEFVDTLADAQNLNCEDAGDVNFEVPSDINFTDQCEALKSQQKMLESLNK